MRRRLHLIAAFSALAAAALACAFFPFGDGGETEATDTPRPSPVAVTGSPVSPGGSPDEPVQVHGTIPFTSPFFINTLSEPFVLLEDQAGFVERDRRFEFPRESQVLGPVEQVDDQTLSYTLTLPQVPQATLVDVDNDGQEDQGVMVFQVAYWSNTWEDPFLEPRDGRGWSNAYTSAITDPEREDEIIGGTLLIWAPDDGQSFPSGFGPDEKLFTEDDPVTDVPAGYSLVDLEQDPFRIYKEPQPEITLVEGEVAVNDYSDMSYEEAFETLFEKVRVEYPFTEVKNIDWEALHDEFSPRAAEAGSDLEFYDVMYDFAQSIPDGHVGLSLNADHFNQRNAGGFGLVLVELSDGRVIARRVIPGYPADGEGIEEGAEILTWDGSPVSEAIEAEHPYFGPYSTEHHRRIGRIAFLTRVPPNESVTLTYQNPGSSTPTEAEMGSVVEYDSLFESLAIFSTSQLDLPLESRGLDDSGFGYIRVATFSDDYSLMAKLWDRHISDMISAEVPALIIDVRINGGGNGGLALDFVGYLFDEELVVSQRSYYNENSGEFEVEGLPTRIEPGPLHFERPVAIIVGPDCASACEGFANAVQQGGRAIVVGHYPTAGMYGEVGRGQYELPAGISMQFPTGRPETPQGELLIEGVGVVPDVQVPVTEDSALGEEDVLLQAAVEALAEELGR